MVNAQHIKTKAKEDLTAKDSQSKIWILARISSDFTACGLTLAANGKKYENKGISHYERINDRESLKRDLVCGNNVYRVWELEFKGKPLSAMLVLGYLFSDGYTIKEFPVENSSKMSYMGFNNCRFKVIQPGLYYVGDVSVSGNYDCSMRGTEMYHQYCLNVTVESDIQNAISFFSNQYGFLPKNLGYANYWTVTEIRYPFKRFYNGELGSKEPRNINTAFYVSEIKLNGSTNTVTYTNFHASFESLNKSRSKTKLSDKQKLAVQLLENLPCEKVVEICEDWVGTSDQENLEAFKLFLNKCDEKKVIRTVNSMNSDLLLRALNSLKTELCLECISYLTEEKYNKLSPNLSELN